MTELETQLMAELEKALGKISALEQRVDDLEREVKRSHTRADETELAKAISNELSRLARSKVQVSA